MIPRNAFAALLMISLGAGPTAAEERAWTDRVRLSGAAEVGFFGGGSESVTPDEGFDIWDARLFVDAELADDVELGDVSVIRNIGFTFEWNLVRTGDAYNDVGLLYLDFEGLNESPGSICVSDASRSHSVRSTSCIRKAMPIDTSYSNPWEAPGGGTKEGSCTARRRMGESDISSRSPMATTISTIRGAAIN